MDNKVIAGIVVVIIVIAAVGVYFGTQGGDEGDDKPTLVITGSTTVNPTEAWLKADSTFAVMASRFTANADFALANRLQIAYVLDPDFKTGRCVPIAEQLVAVVTAKGEADDASTARLLNAYRFLAFHYTINKNRKRSRMYWQKVLELDPDNETAKNVLGIKG